MEGNVKLKYSVDGGSTWSTEYTVRVEELHCWPRPEWPQDLSHLAISDWELFQKSITRLALSFRLGTAQFDADQNPSTAGTLYKFIMNLRCVDMIHLDTLSTAVDFYTEWNASANTMYLTPLDTPDPAFPTVNDETRDVQFILVTKKRYAVT